MQSFLCYNKKMIMNNKKDLDERRFVEVIDRGYYDIDRDGTLTANFKELSKSKKFKKSIEELKNLELN